MWDLRSIEPQKFNPRWAIDRGSIDEGVPDLKLYRCVPEALPIQFFAVE